MTQPALDSQETNIIRIVILLLVQGSAPYVTRSYSKNQQNRISNRRPVDPAARGPLSGDLCIVQSGVLIEIRIPLCFLRRTTDSTKGGTDALL